MKRSHSAVINSLINIFLTVFLLSKDSGLWMLSAIGASIWVAAYEIIKAIEEK